MPCRLVQLMQLVGELNDLDGTVVVGGDFNCTRADLEYKSFARLTRSTELADGQLHPTLSRTNYYKRHRSGADKRVDYLFVRPGSDVEFRSVEAGTLFAEPVFVTDL